MHVLEGKDDLGCVEPRPLLAERSIFHSVQVVEELAAIDELHNHVQKGAVLERKLHLHDEGMVKPRQDVSLRYDKDKLVEQ